MPRVGQLRAAGTELAAVIVAAAAAAVYAASVRVGSHGQPPADRIPHGGNGERVRMRPHRDHRPRYRCSAMGHVSPGQGVAGSKELKSARAALDRAINLPEVCPRGRLAGAEPFTGAPGCIPSWAEKPHSAAW